MADPWPVHTLVFDLDDTLYPEREFARSGFAAVAQWLEREHGIGGFSTVANRLFDEGRRGRVFDEALAELGHRPAPQLITAMVAVYRGHMPDIGLSPDGRGILEWANGRFRLALITDGYLEVQQRKIAALKLGQWMSHVICSDQWGRENWKPSHRPYLELMQAMGGTNEGFLYVGDNPRKDFIGARALGWRTVRLRKPGGEHSGYEPSPEESAHAEITSLQALAALAVPLA